MPRLPAAGGGNRSYLFVFHMCKIRIATVSYPNLTENGIPLAIPPLVATEIAGADIHDAYRDSMSRNSDWHAGPCWR